MKFDSKQFAEDFFKSANHTVTDANESIVFGRELEQIMAQSYDVKYVENRARQIVDFNFESDPGTELITYKQFDEVATAAILEDYAMDSPRVSVSGQQFSTHFVSARNSYGYSLQDWRRAKLAGRPLDAMLAKAARNGIENLIEAAVATGTALAGPTNGFMNMSTVPIITTGVTTGLSGHVWDPAGGGTTASFTDIFNDLAFAGRKVYTDTKTIHMPDTLVIPTNLWAVLSSTLAQATFNDKTVLQIVQSANPWIKRIEPWIRTNSAGADGFGRAMLYKKDPSIVQFMMAQEFESFAPQIRGMSFLIENHARFGGCQFRYPKACIYIDGLSGSAAA